jgi:hypothetical protein
MEFRNLDEAWAFWLSYSGQKGFEVRKRYTNKRSSDGKVTSCRFESRPFGVFVGFNHFRQTVVFGAALMYDETFASFKWLFEAFLHALKVLDLMNIKSLPPHYVLKRWTQEHGVGLYKTRTEEI